MHPARRQVAARAQRTLRDPFVLAALVLHAALALFLCVRLNAWVDEAYTLRSTGAGPWAAYREALGFELQPPLYFVLLAAWRSLDAGLLMARLPSLAASTAVVAILAGLGRRVAGRVGARWLALAAALHPFALYLGSEARGYALVTLLAALHLCLWVRGSLAPSGGRLGQRAALVLVSLAGLYTHFYFGFLLLAGGLALVGRWAALTRYLQDMLVTALLFLPGFLWVPELFGRHTNAYAVDAFSWTFSQSAVHVARLVSGFALPGWTIGRPLAVGALALVAAITWRTRHRQGGLPFAALLRLWSVPALVALALVAVAWQVDPAVVREHHAAVLYPSLLVALLAAARSLAGRRGAALVGLALVLMCGFGSFQRYHSLAKSGDWERVARYLESQADDTPILFLDGETLPVFELYYSGHAPLLGYPSVDPEAVWDPELWNIRTSAELLAPARAAAAADGSLWIVTWNKVSSARVDEFVAQHCTLLEQREFSASRVRHVRVLGG